MLIAVAALLLGMAKTGVPGIGILVVLLLALAFPEDTKLSVGVLLPMLITGDVVAVAWYRRHAQWDKLWRLFPAVALGIGAGAWFLGRVSEHWFRPLLGWLILGLLLLELIRVRWRLDALAHHPVFAALTGLGAGFATTVGNAAGPIMSIYLIARGLPKQQFIGTAAWFFMIVNLSKVPVFVYQGMITRQTLQWNLVAVPLILAGAALGIRVVPHISQTLFNRLVLAFCAVAALKLIL
jgi:uncharacterized membrane protein YfcA